MSQLIPLNSQQTNFDKQAYQYDTATPIQFATVQTLTQLIERHFIPDFSPQTWLDIGCGTGRLSQAILPAVFLKLKNAPVTWYGLDNSAKMLEIFEQNLAGFSNNPAFENYDFSYQTLLADMQSIPLAGDSVDCVVSSFALHWVRQLEDKLDSGVAAMVAELARVLAPDGQIHIAIPVAGSLSTLQQRCPNLPIFPFTSAETWITNFENLIQQQGGKWLYQMTQQFSHNYPNVRALLKELKQMGGTFSHTNFYNNSGTVSRIENLRQYLRDNRAIALDYQVLLLGIKLNTQ